MWVDPGSITRSGGAEEDCFVGVVGLLDELVVEVLVSLVGESFLCVVFGVFG